MGVVEPGRLIGLAILLLGCRDRVPHAANATVPAPPRAAAVQSHGVWIGRDTLSALPDTGAAWTVLRRDAARIPDAAAIADQHSTHDTYTVAAALVCARTGEYCDKAKAQLADAMGSEAGADWLAVGRNLGAYVIAADVMGLRADGNASSLGTRVQTWIASFLTRTDINANRGESMSGGRPIAPFASGSNAAAQEGFVHAAVAAYLGDRAALDRSWTAIRAYLCDPTARGTQPIDLRRGVESGWAHDDAAPCAINPKGASKVVPRGRQGAGQRYRIDGAIINDMRRGGDFQWPPGYTQYPWVGIEGLVPAAAILQRQGYPAFDAADRAILRALEFLWYVRERTAQEKWFDGSRAAETVFLVNRVYGMSFPVATPVGAGRLVGYTDWTHARWTP